ncbi:uncharacterized membrane protein YcaP (DUF421 family) [Bacillus mesophilus]|uniref:DUF421 domain-containing protein n=1 Tax=Bacillus mesophilus TaxID=1808955 RepID=A0A6M0Q2N1_9BACI|nr:DUF421 domain-containing protein [Bacillus mesophilus]MBM7659701.1 uncharacterized membrane protein YcaP (DUF421 family) [Bacillus mesophilus]NEY70567.1 DUF421 domain-containing protein [Bacillus mesophilus]
MEFTGIAIKLVVGYVSLMITTRALGRTQITQITPFDFISALVLGELVGGAIHDKDVSAFQIIYAVLIWGALIYITEITTQKFITSRYFLEGSPSLIIRRGEINYKRLKKNKLDLDQLQNLLRKKDIFSIRDVEFAILETDGTVSVLKKTDSDTPTKKDLNIKSNPVHLPLALVSDGQLVEKNIKEAGVEKSWVLSQLQVHGCNRVRDCLYAEWSEGEALYVIKY